MKRPIARYAVAVAVVGAAMVLRGPLLGRALGEDAPLSIFAGAVAIAAWFGGMKPGLLATVLSLIVGTVLFIDQGTLIPRKLSDRVRCAMFLGEGVMISWLFHEIRSARARTEEQRRQLEKEVELRRRVEAELVAANERKDQFVAAVAHELRNPLSPIRNALEIMQIAGEDRSAIERARGMMERQVDQMTRIVGDLMDVSRVGQGKLQLHKEHVELADVVQTAVEACLPLIERSGHQLTVSLPAETLMLDADPARLIQVFSNLLTNAAKYTERGGRIALRGDREESSVVLRVSDNGIGISPELLPSIFEMFTQGDDGLTRRQGGLGIGLALVHRLVRAHGGSVEARSAGPGQGSEFVVRLPLVNNAVAMDHRPAIDEAPTGRAGQ
ncbi:MAG TPA: ATP-binding protein [Pirellulales bacterium]|jgi:signal transduction histidine kinase|nr:ATP-binding protein [Pirellulales bacterium]